MVVYLLSPVCFLPLIHFVPVSYSAHLLQRLLAALTCTVLMLTSATQLIICLQSLFLFSDVQLSYLCLQWYCFFLSLSVMFSCLIFIFSDVQLSYLCLQGCLVVLSFSPTLVAPFQFPVLYSVIILRSVSCC